MKVTLQMELDIPVFHLRDGRGLEQSLRKSIDQKDCAVLTIDGYGQDVIIRKVHVLREEF